MALSFLRLRSIVWIVPHHFVVSAAFIFAQRFLESAAIEIAYIVTDSPVALSYFYAVRYCPTPVILGVQSAVTGFYKQAAIDGHKHAHVYLTRSKEYNPAGRYQTESEAKQIDRDMFDVLTAMHFEFRNCGTDEADLRSLVANLTVPPKVD